LMPSPMPRTRSDDDNARPHRAAAGYRVSGLMLKPCARLKAELQCAVVLIGADRMVIAA